MIEKNIHHSKVFKIASLVIGLIVVLATFSNSAFPSGFHKSSLSCRVGEHYDALFGSYGRTLPPFDPDALSGEHEAAGKDSLVDLPIFVVLGPDNIEKKVDVASGTSVAKCERHRKCLRYQSRRLGRGYRRAGSRVRH